MTQPDLGAGFRCAGASLLRDEPIAGTASNVRAFLLVEYTGAWGVNALRDARLPYGLGNHLLLSSHAAGVRVLLARRPDRSGTDERPGLRGVRRPGGAVAGDRRVHRRPRGARPRPGRPRPRPVASAWSRPTARCSASAPTAGTTPAAPSAGRPVAAALEAAHPEETWEVSHIGGDRFAANMLVLPHGLYYGRLDAVSALGVAGTPPGRRPRPRPPARPVRAGHAGAGRRDRAPPAARGDPQRRGPVPRRHARADDVTTARFDVAGTTYAVRVRTRHGDTAAAHLPGDAGQPGADPRPTRRLDVLVVSSGWPSPTTSRS